MRAGRAKVRLELRYFPQAKCCCTEVIQHATGSSHGWRWEKHLPDEVGAVAAESRLLEEAGYEFVVLHFVDVLLPQRTFTSEPVGDVLVGRLV